MSAVSHLNSIMNMMGMSKDLLPGIQANMVANPAASAPSTSNFEADLFSLSPLANMLQQFTDMDTNESGDGGETDLSGLANLKQRGEMLAQMLNMKLKNFETGLASSMKNAGLNPAQDLSMKGGDDGISLLNDFQANHADKMALETHLKDDEKLQGQFKEMAQIAQLLDLVNQTGIGPRAGRPGPPGSHASGPAAQYAEQQYAAQAKPIEKKAEASFVVNIMSGKASYSFG